MTTTMKSLHMVPAAAGGHLEMRDIPRPVLLPGHVMVRVGAVALNRGELTVLERMCAGSPAVGGIEFAGTIVEAPQACRWRVGDRVIGHGRSAYADYVCVDPNRLMRLPDAMAFTEGAAIPNVFMTAHDALVTRAGLRAGEAVLVNAASSGIGTAATQIAAFLRAGQIIGTSRTAGKWDRIKPHGATHLLATDGANLPSQVMALTQDQGVDIVIDCLGGPTLQDHLRSMALRGRLISVGRLAGMESRVDLDHLALRRLSLIGVTFRTRTEEETQACFQAFAADLSPGFEAGELRPVIDSVFGFEEFEKAFDRLRSDDQVGKIVMALDNTGSRP